MKPPSTDHRQGQPRAELARGIEIAQAGDRHAHRHQHERPRQRAGTSGGRITRALGSVHQRISTGIRLAIIAP